MPPKARNFSASQFPHPSAAQPATSRNLFVAGFKDALDDDALLRLFCPFGAIESAKVMQDVHTGASRGFGFVLYRDVSNAISAVAFFRTCRYIDSNTLIAAPVPGELSAAWVELKVSYAVHDAYNVVTANTKVYCRNIPLMMTADQLKAILEAHIGPDTVTSIALQPDSQRSPAVFLRHNDPAPGTLEGPRGNVAFVELASPAYARLAVSATSKLRLEGPGSRGPLMTKLAETQKVRSERRKRGHTLDPLPPPTHMEARFSAGPQPALITMSPAPLPPNPPPPPLLPSSHANPTSRTAAAPSLHGGHWVLAPGYSMAPAVAPFLTLGPPMAGFQTYASPNQWPTPSLSMPASFVVGPPLPSHTASPQP